MARLGLEGFDLRDADLSVTPDDRLLVLGGAQRTRDGVRETGSFVSSSADGETFAEPRIVIPLGRWLWRLTWLDDVAYGVSYPTPEGAPSSALLRSTDGIEFETIVPELFSEGRPTEAVIAFGRDR